MSNILNHNRVSFKCKLSYKDYWDFHLHLGREYGSVLPGMQEECLAAFIDTNIPECVNQIDGKTMYSVKIWENAVNNSLVLTNYGLTGVDNGDVLFNRRTISDEEFKLIFYHTAFVRPPINKNLIVTQVSSNLQTHDYGVEIVDDDCGKVAKLYGGFYQGFFRSGDGCEYSILPSDIGNGVSLEFELYRKDFTDCGESNTLNDIYPENKGIFFYWGTRAENKWVRYYGDLCDEEKIPDETVGETTEGAPLDMPTSNPVNSDNKFLIYSRTCGGHTVLDDKEGETPTVEVEVENTVLPDNPFLIYSRTCGGTTVLNDDEYFKEHAEHYNIYSDLWNNALAFQITDDGKVGYKYLVKDCDSEEPNCSYKILSEFSKINNVPYCEWVNIHVRVLPIGLDEMQLMFYVNGRLVLYSKEIPRLNLRELHDSSDKQEGVPFNISLGGGTQGLADVVYEDWRTYDEFPVYPLEKEFGGSFIGYFKSFKFYNCQLNYQQINQNVLYEKPICKVLKIYCGVVSFNTKPSNTSIESQTDLIFSLNEFPDDTTSISVRIIPDIHKRYDRIILAIPSELNKRLGEAITSVNGFSELDGTSITQMFSLKQGVLNTLNNVIYDVWYCTFASQTTVNNIITIRLENE